jgi:hypothetical protein
LKKKRQPTGTGSMAPHLEYYKKKKKKKKAADWGKNLL